MISSRRIAYLVSQYPAVNHTYILREIRELRKLGWDIEVVSIRTDARPISQLTAEERQERSLTWYVTKQGFRGALRAHFVSLISRPRSYIRGIFGALQLGSMDVRNNVRNMLYFTEALIAGQWMQSRGLTHAHIHYASTVGWLMARTFPVTISITIHGSAEFEDPERFHLREKIELAIFVRAISNYGRNQLMKSSNSDGWRKLETLPLGIDPEGFMPAPKSLSSHAEFEIISVGQLTLAKGHLILIDAIARLVKEGRGVRLRLIGEGPDRKVIERHIIKYGLTDAVYLEGALNQDQLKARYRDSDAFVLASLAEGVPVVLMEAMAMQIPCVATRIAGIPELIAHEVDGLLVEPSDASQLTAALAQLMDDPYLRDRIAKAGRRKILERYDLSKNTTLLAHVLENRIPNLLGNSG